MTYDEAVQAIEQQVKRYAYEWAESSGYDWTWEVQTPCEWYTVRDTTGVKCRFRLWRKAESWCYSEIGYGGLATGPWIVYLFYTSAYPDPTVDRQIDVGEPVFLHEYVCTS